MSRYLKFIWAGIFLCPKPLYWVMMGLVAVIFVMGIIANKIVDNPYGDAEPQYKITVGYIIKNGKSVPYKIFYTDEQTNKRTEIPSKNVTIQHISDSIYEIYVRIKRQDGDGYDYAIAKLKKVSDTEYRTVKVEAGREVI